MQIDITHFGEWQRAERERLKISQQSLAEAVGVSTYSIWAYENGKKNPTLLTMVCVAQSLGYDLHLDVQKSA